MGDFGCVAVVSVWLEADRPLDPAGLATRGIAAVRVDFKPMITNQIPRLSSQHKDRLARSDRCREFAVEVDVIVYFLRRPIISLQISL